MIALLKCCVCDIVLRCNSVDAVTIPAWGSTRLCGLRPLRQLRNQYGRGQFGADVLAPDVCSHQQSETAQTSATEQLTPDLRREKFLDRGQGNQLFEVAF